MMKYLLFLLALSFLGCDSHNAKEGISGGAILNDSNAQNLKKMGEIMPGLDHGFEQSPINISSKSAKNDGTHNVTLYYTDVINKVENLGHTVQLDFQEGSSIVANDTTFYFRQCHFHTPSEHHIDGVSYAMEMHIVNIMKSNSTDSIPQYLVIAVLFKEGKENKFIADFLNSIPAEQNSSAELKAGTVKLSDLFGEMPKELKGHYYQYRGLLTTPPYTETVRWYISKHIFEASPAQIEAIHKIEGNNARHVKALYGRVISSD